MLFRDFFPRLQKRAWDRYGERVTERQFKDWREDDLLPGPAAPVGRGRGRSPDRHWAAASYRRALRICRYKSRGARRQSQWWLSLWLSGEPVDLVIVRRHMKREYGINRNRRSTSAHSERWQSGHFLSLSDIVRSSNRDADQITVLLKITGISPDHFRRMVLLRNGTSTLVDATCLMQDISDTFTNAELGLPDGLDRSITPVALKRVSRLGTKPKITLTESMDFIDHMDDEKIAVLAELFKLTRVEGYLLILLCIRAKLFPVDRLAPLLIGMMWLTPAFPVVRIEKLIELASELYDDSREGIKANWRVTGARKRVRRLQRLIFKVTNQGRQGVGADV